MLVLHLLACLIGLVLLARSADELVLGSSALAERVGIPAVVVGVVVIGFGTSAPEMLVSGLAAAGGSVPIAVGNVIGSNIANLTLVLGVAAMVAPVVVHVRVIRREVPLAFAASLAFGLAVQGGVSRLEGLLLLAALAAALVLLVRWALQPPAVAGPEAGEMRAEVEAFLEGELTRPTRGLVLRAGGGLLGTLAGAQALVWGAAGLAREASLSEGFVGVTIVAVGTSLPELMTAAQAARRGENDLIVGNLLGSNLFNALAVGGLVGLVGPGTGVGNALALTGVSVMLLVSVLALGFMARGFQVVRWEAATLIAVFVTCLPMLTG